MPLFAEDIDNCEELEKWVKSMNVSYNSDVNVKNTPDRGVGLFFKPTKTNGEQTELLRIPHMSSFNIYTIRKLCDDKLEADDKKVLKRCLQIVFTICYSASESLILIAYMIGLLMICEKRKIHASVGDDRRWLDDMKGYIGILMKTKVGNLYTDQQNVLEDFLAAFKGNAVLKSSITDVISEKWIEVETAINEEFSEEFERINVSEILQICSAVRSRVLEIPREVETEVCGEEEEKEGRDSDEETNDDFYVDVTLVPVLDFVNHDNHMRNAHFDVDRDSKDIVLYYENDKANSQGTNEEAGGAGEEKKEVEVFISYDKYEDIHFMFANYGFIPQSRGTKVIELPILGYNENSKLDNYKASMRLYEIKQSPNVQFAVEFAETGEICDVKILDEEFYSYLIFDDGLKWREEEDEQVAENEENEDTEEEQPKDEDAGSAVTLQLEFERGYRRCERLVNQLSDERYNELQHSFYDYLGEYLLKFSKRVSIFATITREYELPNGETTNILKLLEFYGQLCKAMRKILVARHKFESHPLADPYTASGYLSRRMLPLYNFENILAGVEMGDLTL